MLEGSNALALEVARLRARTTQAYEQASVESILLQQKNECQCRAHEQEVIILWIFRHEICNSVLDSPVFIST
jgi:hypothetical protein